MRGDAPAGRTAKSMSNEVASSASTCVGTLAYQTPWTRSVVRVDRF